MNANAWSTAATAPMIGTLCPDGPGGRDCACCGQPPGKARTRKRRQRRRAEKQAVKRELRAQMGR